jgi:hypothetical protein
MQVYTCAIVHADCTHILERVVSYRCAGSSPALRTSKNISGIAGIINPAIPLIFFYRFIQSPACPSFVHQHPPLRYSADHPLPPTSKTNRPAMSFLHSYPYTVGSRGLPWRGSFRGACRIKGTTPPILGLDWRNRKPWKTECLDTSTLRYSEYLCSKSSLL